jgi:hypothetical protein
LPVKRLHVKNGTSGASNYGVPGIAIENDTNVSLQFLGGASHQLGITFSDPTTVEAGFIYYNTSSNNLQLKAQNDIIFTQTGNVGIGLTAPSSKLQVGDRLDAETITVGGFYAAGGGSLKFISGYASVPSYTWTTGEILATDDGNFNGRIEFKTGDTGRLGPTIKMVIKNNGRVGIGDTTPSYALDVAGTIRATGDVIAYSDVRVKENIKTIDNSLEKVSKLRGVEFNKIGEDIKSIGVIAQEIEKVIPEVVREDDKGMKSVAYGNITGILIEAIKELKQEIEELKKQIK